MAKINYDNLIENLPDSFAKNTDSNNYKLLQIKTHTTSKVLSDLRLMSDMLNINSAYGATLDNWYGKRINLKRGTATDSQYLIRLKAKKMQNINTASFPQIAEALAAILGCRQEAIHIVESETPNFVVIKDIPLSVIENANFTLEEIIAIVNSLLPINITVITYNFVGTFEFSDSISEYDENAGFANDAHTLGGYVGLGGQT